VNQAHSGGDPIATATLLETVELLAVYLGNTIDLLEPDVIVVGGGVAGVLRPFFDELRARIPSWCINSRCREIPLLSAHYGANSGIAGGAALCN
jgi:predicted NBD/HSP70 family sugar kinase